MERSVLLTLFSATVAVMAAGAALAWGAQVVLFEFLLDPAQLPFRDPALLAALPPSLAFLVGNLRLLVAGMFVASLLACLCGIGMLFRVDSARIVFIVLLLVGVAWNLGLLYLQHVSSSAMVDFMQQAGRDATEEAVARALAMAAASASLLCLVLGAIAGWLMTRRVKAEFGVHR
jgi:hypothetical protein